MNLFEKWAKEAMSIAHIANKKANSNTQQLEDITDIPLVSAVANVWTLDLTLGKVKNFKMETVDGVAKTLAFANVPATGLVQVTVKMKYTTACAITRPASVVWQNAVVPTFTAGKTYFIQYLSDDGGVTWYTSCLGAF